MPAAKKTDKQTATARKPVVANLLKALQERVHQIIGVIDAALQSENLRDRIWAVELLIKRLNPGEHDEKTPKKPTKTKPSNKKIQTMTDSELQAAIADLLKESSS